MNKLGATFLTAAACAAIEYGIARHFFRRTLMRGGNGDIEHTMRMAGTDWSPYLPEMERRSAWLDARHMEPIDIRSYDGLRLHATWFPAGEAPSGKTVICFHGYTSMGRNDYPGLAQFYLGMGYNMLIVDQRAHGESEGRYIGFGVLDRWDALRWIRYIEKRFGKAHEILLHGISMGAATVLMAGGLGLPGCVRAIVSDCAFRSAWMVFESVLRTRYHIPAFPTLHLGNLMAKIHAGYGLDEVDSAIEVTKHRLPILLIHGENDTFVPSAMCREIYVACAEHAEILLIPGAGHGEAYWKNSPLYESTLNAFLARVFTQ